MATAGRGQRLETNNRTDAGGQGRVTMHRGADRQTEGDVQDDDRTTKRGGRT